MTDDAYFVARPELFWAIMQDFQQCFNLSHRVKRDHGCFISGRLTFFLYCLLRRTVPKVNLSTAGDWKSIQQFNSTSTSLLALGDFMRKTQFRNSADRVTKVTVHAEREKSKEKCGAHPVTSAVVDETLNPFEESARNYLKFVCHRK